MRIHIYLHVLLLISLFSGLLTGDNCPAAAGSSMFTIYPKEYPYALSNPLKGFRPNLSPHADRHEYATLVRHYIKWNELENDETDTVQEIKDYCNEKWAGLEEKGIKVIPRVYLDWDRRDGNEYWPADMVTGDYNSEQFVARVQRLVARLGEAWDDDPRVAWVQMGIIGHWGEHHSPAPSEEMQKILGDAFSAAFKKKHVLVRHATEFPDYEVGYYWDSWAHVDQTLNKNHGAAIKAVNERNGRWKRCPIEGETAYNWGNYQVQPGDSPDDTLADPFHREFLIDTIRNLHCTGLGWIANYDTTKASVRAGAMEVQKALGYRFVIPELSCSRKVPQKGRLRLAFKVVNTGSAPFYEKWPVEFSLLDRRTGEVVWKKSLDTVDIRQWIPGDDWDEKENVYHTPAPVNDVDVMITLPDEDQLPPGIYVAALAILDPAGQEPALRFAIENHLESGHHPFGYVGVGLAVTSRHYLDSEAFTDPMKSGRSAYGVTEPQEAGAHRILSKRSDS